MLSLLASVIPKVNVEIQVITSKNLEFKKGERGRK